jgi:sugar (pentulose or hexulose) kinase
LRWWTRGTFASAVRKSEVASMSSAEGVIGTSTASAASRYGSSSSAPAPAGIDDHALGVFGHALRQALRRVASTGSTAWAWSARRSAQRVAERCGSASANTVLVLQRVVRGQLGGDGALADAALGAGHQDRLHARLASGKW